MNQSYRSPLRGASGAANLLLSACLFGGFASAQIPTGSIAVLAQNQTTSTNSVFIVGSAGGVTPVTGSAPTLTGTINQLAIDPVSPFTDPSSGLTTRGHLIVVAATSAGNELWQLYLSGTTIVGDRKLVDLPAGIVHKLHRSTSGCYLALISDGSTNYLSRIAVTESGAGVYSQTLSGFTGGFASGLCTGPDGAAYIGERFNVSFGVLPPSRLARVGTNGALTTVGTTSFTVRSLGWNGTTAGSSLAAGGTSSAALNANFSCGGSESPIGAGVPLGAGQVVLWPNIHDFELDAANGTFVVGMTGGGIGGVGSSTLNAEVRRYGATGCSLSGATLLASFADTFIIDVEIATSDVRYGCETPTSSGSYPVISQVAPPNTGNNWLPTLSGGAPSAPAQLYLGFQTTSYQGLPLPVDVSALGAQPGSMFVTSGTIVYSTATDPSGNASVTIPVPNNPALIGVRAYAQWVIVDALLPYPLPVALSAGLAPAIQ